MTTDYVRLRETQPSRLFVRIGQSSNEHSINAGLVWHISLLCGVSAPVPFPETSCFIDSTMPRLPASLCLQGPCPCAMFYCGTCSCNIRHYHLKTDCQEYVQVYGYTRDLVSMHNRSKTCRQRQQQNLDLLH
jgi:hypothetical protein